jgi:hypothetical protein
MPIIVSVDGRSAVTLIIGRLSTVIIQEIYNVTIFMNIFLFVRVLLRSFSPHCLVECQHSDFWFCDAAFTLLSLKMLLYRDVVRRIDAMTLLCEGLLVRKVPLFLMDSSPRSDRNQKAII